MIAHVWGIPVEELVPLASVSSLREGGWEAQGLTRYRVTVTSPTTSAPSAR